MKVYIWLLLGMLAGPVLFAQNLQDSLRKKIVLRLEADERLIDFELDSEGNILILDGKNRLRKYLAASQYDSSIVVGGQGVREEGFLNPSKIVARNRQSVYVLDKGLQRIGLFNTNLKLMGETNFLQIANLGDWLEYGESILPLSFDINAAGEQFILNGQDNRVYRLGTFGTIAKAFGGSDYGEGSLFAPIDLQIRANNDIWISDTSEQKLMVYNLYGIFQETIHAPTDFRWKHFLIEGNSLLLYNSHKLFVYDIRSQKSRYLTLPSSRPLQDLDLHANKLYLLLGNEVHLYVF